LERIEKNWKNCKKKWKELKRIGKNWKKNENNWKEF
jgi:hypothetical protein